jgi:predicted ABC-type transport system involved in lysophospholipase L1 biosynthesis ATPase subunit
MLIPTLNALENVELPALLRAKTARRVEPAPKGCWKNWGWVNVLITFPRSFPAASNSVCAGPCV